MEINIKKTISGFPLKKLDLKREGIAGGRKAETVLQRRPREISWWAGFFFLSPRRESVFSFSLCLSISISVFPLSHHARVVLYNIIVISSVRGLRRMAAARKCGEENKFNEISVLLHFYRYDIYRD